MGLKVPVRCVETGEVFDSMTAAGLSVGKNYLRVETGHGDISSHTNISGCISGINKTAGGYRWELVHTDSKVSSILPKKKEEKLPKIYKTIKQKPPKQPKIDYPPEGYVYIFRNDWHPENVYKIGSTDNLEGRRSTARTWGPYKCEFYLEVADCKLVESKVHTELSGYRIDRDDLGSEHFDVPLEKAIQALNKVTLGAILDSLMKAA
jgi:hypothetical protein